LNTSTAIGQPSALQISPKTICGSSRLPSRECPRAANSQQRPVSQVAYFSPSWTAFQADRGRDFSVIVDGVSD